MRFDDRKCDRVYWIGMEGADTEKGTLSDPLIVGIYDAEGTLIPYSHVGGQGNTQDNDIGEGRNALLAFTPPGTGDYYLEVAGNGGAAGPTPSRCATSPTPAPRSGTV